MQHKVFVGNVSDKLSSDDLRNYFNVCGSVRFYRFLPYLVFFTIIFWSTVLRQQLKILRVNIYVVYIYVNIYVVHVILSFQRHGTVIDVFLPNPHRGFAFVTFAEAESADKMPGTEHVIKVLHFY